MANKKITELPAKSLPYSGGEVGVVDDGSTTYQADLQYLGIADAAMTYNADGTVATVTKAGRTTTFTYSSGELQSTSDGTITKTFTHDGAGNISDVVIT